MKTQWMKEWLTCVSRSAKFHLFQRVKSIVEWVCMKVKTWLKEIGVIPSKKLDALLLTAIETDPIENYLGWDKFLKLPKIYIKDEERKESCNR